MEKSYFSYAHENAVEDDEDAELEDMNAAKLPPIEKIQKHLPDGGNYFETIKDGWSMTGFLLK